MAIGFLQSLYALDAADGESGGGEIVINGLIQALLGYAEHRPRVAIANLTVVHRTSTLPQSASAIPLGSSYITRGISSLPSS